MATMDDSVGSSSSSPLLTAGYPAQLDGLHVTVPCKTSSDALITSLSVALTGDLSSTVIDAFLRLFQNPAFCCKEVTFRTAYDISKHISEQRKRIAQRRSLAPQRSPSTGKTGPYRDETRNVYGVVPQIIVDMVAQQIAVEMAPFSNQVESDKAKSIFSGNRCSREQDLLNMTLVHRTWTTPAVRVLRPRVKVVGPNSLQAFLRSPRMGPWILEFYFVESFEGEDVREMTKLLKLVVRNTPSLRKLAVRTWWSDVSSNSHYLDGVIRELVHLRELESLWLFTNRSQIACLPTLVATLPYMPSLKGLHLKNWIFGRGGENIANTTFRSLVSTASPGARLTTLSFIDSAVSAAVFLPWLLRDSPLENLELHTKDLFLHDPGGPSPVFYALLPSLPKLKSLRLHHDSMNDDRECTEAFIRSCTNIRNFSIVDGEDHELVEIPESTENLHVHFSISWPVSGRRLAELVELRRLARLRTIRLTKDPVDIFVIEAGTREFGAEGLRALESSWDVGDVERVCKDRRIKLTYGDPFVSLEQQSAL